MTLKNLNEVKNQSLEKYKREFVSEDYFIDDAFKQSFKKIGGIDIVYHSCYAEVTSAKSLKIYIPYQWFIIASYFVDYYQELINYKKVVDSVKDSFDDFSETIKDCRSKEDSAKEVVALIQGISDEEKDFLVKFLSDYAWWGGGKTIDRDDFFVSPILNLAGLVNNTQAFVADIVRELAEQPQATRIFSYQKANITPSSSTPPNPSSAEKDHSQTIFYGVPGCGKSHYVEKKIEREPQENCPRVVFHPEYTNTDFIGQILPKLDSEGTVSYDFSPGPFTTILLRACANLDTQYYLVIEEINRGNAAAIFGEVFQLLDRKNGWSRYTVENHDVIDYIQKIIDGKIEGVISGDEAERAYEHLENGLRLPPNLSILATMNTSDQNVFTLDNAFQRRFDMQLIENEFGIDPESKTQEIASIAGLDIQWGIFQKRVNKFISETSKNRGLSSMEDKRIGCWFVKQSNNQVSVESFANKVLKYLWDDAFKFDREKIFDPKFDSLEDVIKAYKDKTKKPIEVFSSDFQKRLLAEDVSEETTA